MIPAFHPAAPAGPYDLSALGWLVAAVAALCIGLAKTGFGGMGLVSVTLMAYLLPARESTGVILPMLIFADCLAVQAYWKHAVWREIWRPLPAAILGIVAGALLLRAFSGHGRFPDAAFRRVIGAVVLALTFLQFARNHEAAWLAKLRAGLVLAWPMGALAGFTTMLANAAGPVMTLYLLAVGLPKYEFVGTSGWFFFILNLTKVPFSYGLGLIHHDSLRMNLFLAPAVAAGALLGKRLLRVIPQALYENVLLVFTVRGGGAFALGIAAFES